MKPQAFDFNTSSRNLANLPKPGGFPVKYRCPSCVKEFSEFVGFENIHYCYNCGESIYWGGVISHINSQQSDLMLTLKGKNLEVFKKGLLGIINELNEGCDRPEMIYIAEEDDEDCHKG